MNELYDFIIPLDLQHYAKARDSLTTLIPQYERARKNYHKKELNTSTDLERELATIDMMIGHIMRLTDLVPEFEDPQRKHKEKNQL